MSGKDVNSLTLPQNARYTNLEFAENQFVKTLAGLGDHYEGKESYLPPHKYKYKYKSSKIESILTPFLTNISPSNLQKLPL